jgi:hypothetical protein
MYWGKEIYDEHSSGHDESTDILYMRLDGEAYHWHASSVEDKEAKIVHLHLPFSPYEVMLNSEEEQVHFLPTNLLSSNSAHNFQHREHRWIESWYSWLQ